MADYTGGTKTMTVALVCAALESHDIDPQLVVGIRVDLISASDGTQAAASVDVSRMRVDREVTRHLRVWERFAYHQAARALNQIPNRGGYVGSQEDSACTGAERGLGAMGRLRSQGGVPT